MAGVDTEFEGTAKPQAGIKIGYLAQEPELEGGVRLHPNRTTTPQSQQVHPRK